MGAASRSLWPCVVGPVHAHGHRGVAGMAVAGLWQDCAQLVRRAAGRECTLVVAVLCVASGCAGCRRGSCSAGAYRGHCGSLLAHQSAGGGAAGSIRFVGKLCVAAHMVGMATQSWPSVRCAGSTPIPWTVWLRLQTLDPADDPQTQTAARRPLSIARTEHRGQRTSSPSMLPSLRQSSRIWKNLTAPPPYWPEMKPFLLALPPSLL